MTKKKPSNYLKKRKFVPYGMMNRRNGISLLWMLVTILTDSPNPQVYWRVLKKRLIAEGNQTVTNCNGLKMRAADGKMRFTDIADTEQLFRLIQSIPSPKAEPFKQWMVLY